MMSMMIKIIMMVMMIMMMIIMSMMVIGYDDDYDNKLASRMLDIGAVSQWNKKALTSR